MTFHSSNQHGGCTARTPRDAHVAKGIDDEATRKKHMRGRRMHHPFTITELGGPQFLAVDLCCDSDGQAMTGSQEGVAPGGKIAREMSSISKACGQCLSEWDAARGGAPLAQHCLRRQNTTGVRIPGG
eukprot:TRINITY_DN31760_c0_g1_i1.p2 TRINITY_DN31760_c0_g1~~TRINITY_DN31760_c0_g1_i1.p2  ORF type:complete len:128 (-),score=1.29 TRINITY_DN31760_c0_g1_i1:594-977(-)